MHAAADHEALTKSEGWPLFAFVGFQRFPPGLQELRRCPQCGETLSKTVSETEAILTAAEIGRLLATALANLGAVR